MIPLPDKPNKFIRNAVLPTGDGRGVVVGVDIQGGNVLMGITDVSDEDNVDTRAVVLTPIDAFELAVTLAELAGTAEAKKEVIKHAN